MTKQRSKGQIIAQILDLCQGDGAKQNHDSLSGKFEFSHCDDIFKFAAKKVSLKPPRAIGLSIKRLKKEKEP